VGVGGGEQERVLVFLFVCICVVDLRVGGVIGKLYTDRFSQRRDTELMNGECT
jgi:hypothetical protein